MNGIDAHAHVNSDRENDDRDEPEMVRCDHCEAWHEDGTGHRLGSDYVCTECFYSHPVVVGEVMAALLADIKAGK